MKKANHSTTMKKANHSTTMKKGNFPKIKSKGDSRESSTSNTKNGTAKAACPEFVRPLHLYVSSHHGCPFGIGGLIIDATGKWIKGYMGQVDVSFTDQEVELTAMYHGLVILDELGYKGAKVYHIENVAQGMKRLYESDFRDPVLYRKCCKLWASTGSTLCPVTNAGMADAATWLAKMAGTQSIDFHTLSVPPFEMGIYLTI